MSLRQKDRFDYRIYDKKGEKVRKNSLSMGDIDRLCVDELKVLDSLNFHLALNAIEDLFSEEECKGAICTVTDLYDSYRSVHVELRKALGDTHGEKSQI